MSTRIRYSFTILRYIHDVVTGEFANVGVVLYAPDARFLGARCAATYGRLSGFFGNLDPEHFKRLMGHIEFAVSRVGETVGSAQGKLWPERVSDVMPFVHEILPADDSSLQFGDPGGGVTDKPEAMLDRLFERYVERYSHKPAKTSRLDEEVLGVFRRELRERAVLGRMHSKTIVAPSYEHEFPHAWKNGKWNACEAVSFDMKEAHDVAEKANKWLGRGVSLYDSQEQFKLYLLLGRPSQPKLMAAFEKATRILRKMPCELALVMEDDAASFADSVRADLAAHEET